MQMRLKCVDSGHRAPQRMILNIIGRATGSTPDVARTLGYRPELFGRQFGRAVHDALTGPSEWSRGERELFAAFVSRQNQCPF